jgi:hypothetical protein
MKREKTGRSSLLRILVFVFVGCSSIGFILIAVCPFFSSDIPQFFPFNEKNGEYTILKGSSESPFMVGYKGPGTCCGIVDQDGYTAIIVGNSEYNLLSLIGKKVIISKGAFVSSDTQCILDTCKKIGGPYVVVHIDEMEIVQDTLPR